MALFSKKKKKVEIEDIRTEEPEIEIDEEQPEVEADPADENGEAVPADEPEKTPEEVFKARCAELSNRVRLMFPKQMLIGFYYAELQSEGYIDDFVCITTNNQKIERSDIPSKCGMALPDMVAREERLEQAFFRFRKAAEAYSQKPCNAVSLTMLNNGQVKLDITSEELKDGEEELRYGKWREMVDKTEVRPAPKKIPEEKLRQIQQQAQESYSALGTEFFSFLPDEAEFKIAYFYAECNENGVFYHHRMILNDDTILDGAELFERFGMDKEQAQKDLVEVVRLLMNVRKIFTDNGEMPFTNATLSVTQAGEFSSSLSFSPVSAATEQERLEKWKAAHTS